MRYFVSGIGTEVGKTVISALICEALQADYWKPVQAGDLSNSDSIRVRKLISDNLKVHKEAYRLNTPASPHTAAALDGIRIETSQLRPPYTENILVIEGAGGLHVPLNGSQTILDVLQVWDMPVILVSRNYLGSINHTLLSAEVLQQRGVPIAGIVFNGEPNPSGEELIASYSGIPVLGHIPELDENAVDDFRAFARKWRPTLLEGLEKRHPFNVKIEQKVGLFYDKKEGRQSATF